MIKKTIELSLLSNDTVFANKIASVLENHLTNPEFNTKVFCKHMNLSRTQLHRKIKANTGLSTSSFIHYQRIKASTELLKSFKADIKSIGLSVGYTDPSYFSKCFKKFMGKSPSEYIKTH